MMWSNYHRYAHLTSGSQKGFLFRAREVSGHYPGGTIFLIVSIGLNILFLVMLGKLWLHSEVPSYQMLYSPAQKSLSYQDVVFHGGFGLNSSAYSGFPNEKNDEAWKNLYNFGISKISAAEARNMANRTLPIPGDEENYIVSLSVFHQLHCLNRVRLAVYGDVDWTDISDSTGITHIDHCINALRQTLMCSADITPIVWSRDLRQGRALEVMEVVHTCRNFEDVQKWGLERRIKSHFNFTAVVDHDPLGWGGTHL